MSLRKRSIYQYVLSILAAAFGVQSEASRERDFTRGTRRSSLQAGSVSSQFLS